MTSSTCRPSISTSARTRSTAIRRRVAARKAALTVLDRCSTLHRPGSRRCSASPHGGGLARAHPGDDARCICELFPTCRPNGATTRSPRNGARSAPVRRVVTGALEIERAEKRIGSSLEAAPDRHVSDAACSPRSSTSTSPRSASPRPRRSARRRGPGGRLPARRGARRRRGAGASPKARKCARSWKTML
jgi:hypothetical protein